MKKKIAALALAAALAASVCGMTGCASIERELKSIDSEMSGGLQRTVTLYDEEGEKLDEWEGRIDIRFNEAGQTLFDLNGKRVLIDGGIVVSEEQ